MNFTNIRIASIENVIALTVVIQLVIYVTSDHIITVHANRHPMRDSIYGSILHWLSICQFRYSIMFTFDLTILFSGDLANLSYCAPLQSGKYFN